MTDQNENSIADPALAGAVFGMFTVISGWATFALIKKLTTPSVTAPNSRPGFTFENIKNLTLKSLVVTLAALIVPLYLSKFCIEKSFWALWAISKFSIRTAMSIAYFMAPHGIMQFLANRNIHSISDLLRFYGSNVKNASYSSGRYLILTTQSTTGRAINFISNSIISTVSAVKNKITSSFGCLYNWATGSEQEQAQERNLDEYREDGEDDNEEYLIDGEPFTLAHIYSHELEHNNYDFEEANNEVLESPTIHQYNLRLRIQVR